MQWCSRMNVQYYAAFSVLFYMYFYYFVLPSPLLIYLAVSDALMWNTLGPLREQFEIY